VAYFVLIVFLRNSICRSLQSIVPAVHGKGKGIPIQAVEPLGLREIEAPTFSDIRLADGANIVSRTRRPLFTPRKIPGTSFC
jgi:hypothetical protein